MADWIDDLADRTGSAAHIASAYRLTSPLADPGARADAAAAVAERSAEARAAAAESREQRRATGHTEPGDRLPLGEFLQRRRERRLSGQSGTQDDGPMSR